MDMSSHSKSTIYLYSGPGASRPSVLHTLAAVSPSHQERYSIQEISPQQVIEGSWMKQAALFIMPGGADIPYTRSLNGIGNHHIRSYVENGGAYLGICAGSYYGSGFVDFAKDSPLEVQGPRELALFPGTCRGPLLAPYDYHSESGARAGSILWQQSRPFEKESVFHAYHNGGGYFVNAHKEKNVEILATYAEHPEKAAIVQCSIGSGSAILSGIHVEYDPLLLNSRDKYLSLLLPRLIQANEARRQLFSHLLERLGLKL